MALYGISLNAVTATGPGVAIYVDAPKRYTSLQVSATGSPDAFSVNLEYTLDGIQWNAFSGSGTPGTIVERNLPAFLGLRANLISLSGGTNPTITTWIAAA